MKKQLVSVLLAASMVASLTACSGSGAKTETTAVTAEGETGKTGGETNTSSSGMLNINLGSEPDHLDPALNSSVDGACLALNTFAGLFTYDSEGKLQQDLVDKYEVSKDGLTYTFTLKDGLKWSDGSELTTADFEYSWKRAANPKTAADYGYLFDVFAKTNDEINVKADGNKLTAVLAAPCPYFLDLCAFPTFMPVPKAAVEAADKDGTNPGAWAADAGFISNGAYTLKSWTHDQSMVYVKNPNYHNVDKVTMDELHFMLSADDTTIFSAYNSGDLDFIDTVPTDEIAALKENSEFYIVDQLGTYFVSFNVNSDIFAGKTVEEATTMRKALSLLIDRDYIVENVGQTGQKIATTFVPEGMADGNGGEFKNKDYINTEVDVDQAIELLKSVGYEFDDSNKLSSSTPISFEYLTNNTTGHIAVAESIQQDFSAIGIDMKIKQEDWKVFLNDRKAGNFTIARDGWIADFDDPINMLEMWTTDSGNNNTQFGRDTANTAAPAWADYDKLIDSIRTCLDLGERVNLMHQAEDMLMNTGAVVPLYYYNDVYMCKTNVKGTYSTVYGYKYFMYSTKE